MLISHEVPLCLLELSRDWNDYDYALLHMIMENEEYEQFYKDSIEMGREVILDNSIIELGAAMDIDTVAEGVKRIHPTYVVVPDSFANAAETMDWFDKWELKYKDLDVKTIGVVHGDSYEELVTCYKYMSEHADVISIPFGLRYWTEICDNEDWNVSIRKSCGRRMFIHKLVDNGIWDYSKPHHLLGCNCPWEFDDQFYRDHIRSIDTSNPIMAAFDNSTRYEVCEKPKARFAEHCWAEDLPIDIVNAITTNVDTFRKICEEEI